MNIQEIIVALNTAIATQSSGGKVFLSLELTGDIVEALQNLKVEAQGEEPKPASSSIQLKPSESVPTKK